MKWILCEDRNSNQSQSFNATNNGIPGRAYTTCEDLAPHIGQPEYTHPTESKIKLLYPSTWTQAERTDGLLPGIKTGAGHTLNQVDDREEHSSNYSDGKPQ